MTACFVKGCVKYSIANIKAECVGDVSLCDDHYDEGDSILLDFMYHINLITVETRRKLRRIGCTEEEEPGMACIQNTNKEDKNGK